MLAAILAETSVVQVHIHAAELIFTFHNYATNLSIQAIVQLSGGSQQPNWGGGGSFEPPPGYGPGLFN